MLGDVFLPKRFAGLFGAATGGCPGEPGIGDGLERQVVCGAGSTIDGRRRDRFLGIRLLRVRDHAEVQAVRASVLSGVDHYLVRKRPLVVDVVACGERRMKFMRTFRLCGERNGTNMRFVFCLAG